MISGSEKGPLCPRPLLPLCLRHDRGGQDRGCDYRRDLSDLQGVFKYWRHRPHDPSFTGTAHIAPQPTNHNLPLSTTTDRPFYKGLGSVCRSSTNFESVNPSSSLYGFVVSLQQKSQTHSQVCSVTTDYLISPFVSYGFVCTSDCCNFWLCSIRIQGLGYLFVSQPSLMIEEDTQRLITSTLTRELPYKLTVRHTPLNPYPMFACIFTPSTPLPPPHPVPIPL